ncbi:methyltransferase family protein [Poseidonibacter lekithochrous]|uniref:methyltransferase family protein n=1 Tax=Poseidonibacter lekithochrous TaxID=1904463 RepID=UPI0008FCBE52|nr:isoprenylcysteine carboxylmethyltransferase family protein [Poseidonibacter lekithochrous]QKJ23540.1 isoprenylcysteine carboxylmethyltransferase family protein [Poseidonibacter lekithochrous]
MSLELKIPPAAVMLFFMVLMYFISSVFSSLNIDFMFQMFLSIETAVSGFVLIVAASYVFNEKGTSINPMKPESASSLVTNGIYKFTRNPMYLGIAVILFAWLIFLGNVLNIINIVLFILYMNRYQIIPEERALEKKFGDDYLSYRTKVKRWL